ncbi:Phytochrome-like protein cph1 [Nocardioides aquaticus]|uniref:Sensor-like histidine kinase SenX3 n=1 Tax=Nocardioides aquaticus TaxID=160826 RepID=A0ABX8ECM9_9ACTN|nr:ATP-binding protein [Nocardioides aquaticus]QVT78120.1 Phytochrome-like protein cph1 [Nocardioides aquaticus]
MTLAEDPVDGVPRPRVVAHLGWALVLVLLVLVGRLTVVGDESLGLVWPAAGAAFMWLFQQRGRPASAAVLAGIAAAVGVATALTGASTLVLVIAVVVNVGEAALAVLLVRRWCPQLLGAGGQDSVHDPGVVARGVAAVALATGVGAVAASLSLAAAGLAGPGAGFLDWWARHLTGLVVVAAVTHLLWERLLRRRAGLPAPGWTRTSRLEAVALGVVSLASYGTVFLQDSGLPLTFLLMVPAIWVASRFSTLVAVLHSVVLGSVGVALTVTGRGPFGDLATAQAEVLVVQAFLLTVLLTVLAIGSGRDERQRLVAELVVSHQGTARRAELLDAMTDAMDEGLVVLDRAGVILRTNLAARELLEITDTGYRSSSREYAVLRPDGTPMPFEEHPSQRALREGRVAPEDVVLRDVGGGERVLSVTAAPLSSGVPGAAATASLVVYREVTAERQQRARLADFAAVAAHDLRNPLTSVGGWVDLARMQVAKKDGADPVALDRALGRARSAVDRMASLVDDLLAQAHAEGGALVLVATDLGGAGGLVRDVAGELDLAVEVADGPWPEVLVDADLVRQLVANLLGNAHKYVAPGVEPRVCVSSQVAGARLVVRVEDNGIGVPEGQHDQVFERFHRAHAEDGSYPGTGLGLAICRTVVQRHEGSIVCTPAPGGGTAFTFDLPLAATGGAEGPAEGASGVTPGRAGW